MTMEWRNDKPMCQACQLQANPPKTIWGRLFSRQCSNNDNKINTTYYINTNSSLSSLAPDRVHWSIARSNQGVEAGFTADINCKGRTWALAPSEQHRGHLHQTNSNGSHQRNISEGICTNRTAMADTKGTVARAPAPTNSNGSDQMNSNGWNHQELLQTNSDRTPHRLGESSLQHIIICDCGTRLTDDEGLLWTLRKESICIFSRLDLSSLCLDHITSYNNFYIILSQIVLMTSVRVIVVLSPVICSLNCELY